MVERRRSSRGFIVGGYPFRRPLGRRGYRFLFGCRFFGDRLNIKEQSCRAALNMLREWLDQKTPPRQPEPPGPPGA